MVLLSGCKLVPWNGGSVGFACLRTAMPALFAATPSTTTTSYSFIHIVALLKQGRGCPAVPVEPAKAQITYGI